MATANTARMQHIRPGLGSARNVATTTDLQHVRQRTCRLVSHFANRLTGTWRSDADSPATGVNEIAAQQGYLLVNAPLLETVTALVPQQVCMLDRQKRYVSMASLWRYVWGVNDRVARYQSGSPARTWLSMDCSCSAASTRSHSAVATSVQCLSAR